MKECDIINCKNEKKECLSLFLIEETNEFGMTTVVLKNVTRSLTVLEEKEVESMNCYSPVHDLYFSLGLKKEVNKTPVVFRRRQTVSNKGHGIAKSV